MKKKEKNNETPSLIKHELMETLKIPCDIVMSEPVITLNGRREMYVENYKSILEYSDTRIRIKTSNGRLEVSGKRLMIKYYCEIDMKITGYIIEVKFL